MNIDKKKLVDLLVEKTSMERQEVKKQLDQLIDRILDAAKRGKALEIKEFGLFYFDEEGELKFEASEELSTEISFKYAGMKPVEIKPERDTAISSSKKEDDDIDEIEDEDIFKEEIEAEEFDEPEKELPESQEEDTSEIDEIFDTVEEEEDDKEEGEDEKDILEDPFTSEVEEPAEEEPTSKVEDFKPVSRQPVRKTKDHTGLFILLIIIILAVLIGGYFYYVSTQTDDPSETSQTYPAQTETMTADESEALTNENVSTSTANEDANETGDQPLTAEPAQAQIPSEQEPVNEVSQDDVASDDDSISMANTDQPRYGLMGSVIQEANDGYSIVIHSFNSEENARSAAEQLRTEGYRVIVNTRTVNQNGVWRVSVGQFQTLENAQQATTRLPDPYNTQNFIQRIQLN